MDISLTAGVDTTAVGTGLATIRNEVATLGSEVQATLARSFAVTSVIAGLQQTVDAMHQIHHEAERFSIDSDALQKIAIPAKEAGISMEAVARAMNLATLAGAKASEGSKEFASAFHQLNINVLEYNALTPDQKILAVAEAFEASSKSADDYAAVAKILGTRFGTELIPAFQGIIAALKDGDSQLQIFSKSEIAAGDAAYKLEQQLFRFLQVDFFAPVVKGVFVLTGALIDAAQAATDLLGWLARVAQLDFKGAANYGANLVSVLKGQGPGFQFTQNALNPPATAGPGAAGFTPGGPGGGIGPSTFGGGGSPGGGPGGGSAPGFDDFEARQEKLRLAALADEERLNDLLAQRADLQQQLDEGNETRNLTDEEEGKLMDNILSLTEEIEPLNRQIQDSKAAIAEQDQKSAQAVDEQIQKGRDRAQLDQLDLQIIQARNAGDQQTAALLSSQRDILKISVDYDEQIQKAIDSANKAREQGLEATAEENEKLAAQLEEEKAIAIQIEQEQKVRQGILDLQKAQIDTIKEGITLRQQQGVIDSQQAQNEQHYVDLQVKSNSLQDQINAAYGAGNTALAETLQAQKDIVDEQGRIAANQAAIDNLYNVGATQVGNLPYNDLAYFAKNGISFGSTTNVYAAALAYSRGLKPGSDEYNKLVEQINAEDQLRNLQGTNLGWEEQLNRDKLVQWYAGIQAQQATKLAGISNQQEIQFWQNIANGHPEFNAGNPYTAIFGTNPDNPNNMIPGVPVPGAPTTPTTPPVPVDPFATTNSLLQQILQILTPQAGGH